MCSFFFKTFLLLIHIHIIWINKAHTAKNTYNPAQIYNFPTDSPINVDLDAVVQVYTPTPLQFTAGFLEKAQVLNTGKSAIVRLGQARTSDTVSGGVLYPHTYIYEFCRFYWVNDTSKRAGTTFNNRGQALEVSLYYWNSIYGNFSEAIHHRNGLAVFTLPIQVTSLNGSIFEIITSPQSLLPNPFFILFQKYLVQVKKARTQVPALLSFTYLWYVLFVTQFYYAYPGSYYDESTNKTYYCSTILLHPNVFLPFITDYQFQSFTDLMDDKGRPLTNQAPIYRSQGRPVVKAVGVTVVPFLT